MLNPIHSRGPVEVRDNDIYITGGRHVAYVGPHHTPQSEYPKSCQNVDQANAARLAQGWNLLNRLEEMGIDADKVLEIVEALKAFTHPDLSEACGGNIEGDKSPLFGRNKALLTLGDFRKARRVLGLPVDTSERNLGK